jgi:hypothetical protein
MTEETFSFDFHEIVRDSDDLLEDENESSSLDSSSWKDSYHSVLSELEDERNT